MIICSCRTLSTKMFSNKEDMKRRVMCDDAICKKCQEKLDKELKIEYNDSVDNTIEIIHYG